MKRYLILFILIVCLVFVAGSLLNKPRTVDIPFPVQNESQTEDQVPVSEQEIPKEEEVPMSEEEILIPVVEEEEEGVDPFGRYIGDGCKTISLCNGPITCVNSEFDDSNIGGTCVARPEYACYQDSDARCEKQSNDQCGWTQTEELASCVAEAKASWQE